MDRDPLTIPDLVVLPLSTEEVQGVMRIANRYRINVITMGSGVNLSGACVPRRPRNIVLDLKRMDKIMKIDEENKVIRMQPCVSYARVQAETMKRGLWNGGTPSGPSTNSVTSNILAYGGIWQTALAYGLGIRGLVGVTIVLSNGDVIRTGSHGMTPGDSTYWHGPGPDLKAFFEMGTFGAMGVVTEVLLKLHTWVGGEWPQEEEYGHPPLPKNHRLYLLRFETPEQVIRAGYEICHSGIGIGCNVTMEAENSLVGECHQALSIKRYDEKYYEPHWMYVVLAGFSPRQIDYEEKILLEIIKEVGGELLDEQRKGHLDNYNQDCFRSGDFVRWIRYGIYAITGFGRGPVGNIIKTHEFQQSVVRRNDVPNVNTTWPWGYAYERGYWWIDERGLWGDQLDHARAVYQMAVELVRNLPKNPSGYWTLNEPHGVWLGPQIGPNFHLMVKRMKQVFDPKDIMNPDVLTYMRPPEKRKEEKQSQKE
jgi:hypothetical protein